MVEETLSFVGVSDESSLDSFARWFRCPREHERVCVMELFDSNSKKNQKHIFCIQPCTHPCTLTISGCGFEAPIAKY